MSTKAGYGMWPGPYGEWGSKKSLAASVDKSPKRMNLDNMDNFNDNQSDSDTPLEETMSALDGIVRLGTPCLIHQPYYSMMNKTN